ncbi:hypothetical protein N7478_010256 [Penicillium angulare]|uniref:uncharacterized protein n=1 Tax=Penicillium angulare TaxID=116970 RepID=UPI00254203AF|nr:uncharacterized protein N7478_010256 [Penicillium angulare]KAJ5267448.1 hypothetical protein N7478_010256 [Penicillium angulare]
MYSRQGGFHLEYKRRSLNRSVSSLVPSVATPTDTVKKEQLVNQISDEDVMPLEPVDTPAASQCVCHTWRVPLK